VVETRYYDQCEMDTLKYECSLIVPFMPLTQAGGGGHPRALTCYCVRNLYVTIRATMLAKISKAGSDFRSQVELRAAG
jgi:hypothetical protein